MITFRANWSRAIASIWAVLLLFFSPNVFAEVVEGSWIGSTEEDSEFSFVVGPGQAITELSAELLGCSTVTLNLTGNIPIVDNTFEITGGSCPHYTIEGTFDSTTSASGTVTQKYQPIPYVCPCSGTGTVGWTATGPDVSTTTTSVPTTTVSTTTTTVRPLCTEGGRLSCDDGNVCTDDVCTPAGECVNTPNSAACDDGDDCTTDQCVTGVCVGVVGELDGVSCKVEQLLSVTCEGEALPKKLEQVVRKKAKRARRFVDKAASAGNPAKGEKFLNRASKQLDVIPKKTTKAAKSRKAGKQISETCRAHIDGLVQDRQQLIAGFASGFAEAAIEK